MAMSQEVLAALTPDEMPSEDLKLVAQMIGVENTLKLIRKFRTHYIHFPDFWQANIVQKWVSYKYPEHDVERLAYDLDVSKKTVWRAIANKRVRGPWKKPPPPPPPEQLTLLQ